MARWHSVTFAFLCWLSVLHTSAKVADVDDSAAAASKVALVTGAAGFIGSHVVMHCLNMGMQVIALDDLSGGFLSNLPPGATFVRGDLKDALLLERVFREHRIHYVYHLGAYAAEGLSHFVRSFNYRTNLVGSIEILNQAVKHGVECFVFTSSIAVYGSINDLSQMQNSNRSLATAGHKPKSMHESKGLSENDQPSPEDPYGIAKYAFELDLHAAKELFDIDFIIFRPHNVYGPHQNMFDKYRNVVGIFINQIANGIPLTVFGNGEQVRAFSYIDDVAPIIARGPLVPKARNEIFNVGGDRPYTVNDLTRAIIKEMGNDPENYPIHHEPARLEVEVAVSTHEKVKKFFSPPPSISLEEGLRKTVSWYRSEGKFFQPVEFASVEVKARMPPSWLRADLVETAVCKGSRVLGGALRRDGEIANSQRDKEEYLDDDDLAFFLTCFRETNLVPGAIRSIRRTYKRSPLLVDVSSGGASLELQEICRRNHCQVLETQQNLAPVSQPESVTFSCDGYLSRLELAASYAHLAKFIVTSGPDIRILGRIRVPRDGYDVYQFGDMELQYDVNAFKDLGAVEGFPAAHSTNGAMVDRYAITRMADEIQHLTAHCGKHPRSIPSSASSCLYSLAGIGRLRLRGSSELGQSARSCADSSSSVYDCYKAIHDCKVREGCYERISFSEHLPSFLQAPVKEAYFATERLLSSSCFVASEVCVCKSVQASRRAAKCIAGQSYACPSLIHSLQSLSLNGTFIDCIQDEGGENEEEEHWGLVEDGRDRSGSVKRQGRVEL